MRRIGFSFMAALTLAMPLGCGTDGDGESTETSELARIDFEDGNSVTFEALQEGLLISEHGPQVNKPHLAVRERMSALDAFRRLAPGREVPSALAQAHARMYPEGWTPDPAVSRVPDTATAPAPSTVPDPSHDEDLEHTGEFQQSLPFQSFKQQMCDFPSEVPNYKHSRIFGHTHTTEAVRTAYFAIGSDVGTTSVKACADGACGKAVVVQAGVQNSGYYEAGQHCTRSCLIIGGCRTVCSNRTVTFQMISQAISSNIQFHDCARFTR